MGKDRLQPEVNPTQRQEVAWPKAAIPDFERLEASMKVYTRIVRDEQRPLNRPQFQMPPEKRGARIN